MAIDAVLDLEQLRAGIHAGTPLGVVGHPIAHSLSPLMHGAALARLAADDVRFRDWSYRKFDIAPESLAEALGVFHAKGFVGLNLTIPHKVLACGLVESCDPDAALMGAVNTLVRTPTGWAGFNTDGAGMGWAIGEDLGRGLRGGAVVLLGAGGAARAAAVQCLRMGCASLWIVNRNPERLGELLRDLAPVSGGIPVSGGLPAGLPASPLVINATSVGMKPGEGSPLDLAGFPAGTAVFDMIYKPACTPLLAQAKALGFKAANGLGMLAGQGALALSLWTGRKVDPAWMREALSRVV